MLGDQLVDVDREKYIIVWYKQFLQSAKKYSRISSSRFFTPVNQNIKMLKMFRKQK